MELNKIYNKILNEQYSKSAKRFLKFFLKNDELLDDYMRSLDDIIRTGKKRKTPVIIDNKEIQNGGEWLNKVDKIGFPDGNEAGSLITNMVRTPNVNKHVLNNFLPDLVYDETFLKKYKNLSLDELKKTLKSNGYTDDAIDVITDLTSKHNHPFKKVWLNNTDRRLEIMQDKIKNLEAQYENSKTKPNSLKRTIFKLKTEFNNLIDYSKTKKYKKMLVDTNPKVIKQREKTKQAKLRTKQAKLRTKQAKYSKKEAEIRAKGLYRRANKIFGRTRRTGKNSRHWITKTFLVFSAGWKILLFTAAGILGYAIHKNLVTPENIEEFFNSISKKDRQAFKRLSECLLPLVDDRGASLIEIGGVPHVKYTDSTGDKIGDAHGGVILSPYGTVTTVDGKYSGKYSCGASGDKPLNEMSLTAIYEQSKQDKLNANKFSKQWRDKIKDYEPDNEDFSLNDFNIVWNSEPNNTSIKDINKKTNTKDVYSQPGAQKYAQQPNYKQTTTKIHTKPVIKTSGTKKCNQFPMTLGCYNELLKPMQVKLGVKPDGVFGSITDDAIEDYGLYSGGKNHVLTKKIYNLILTKFA